MKYGMIRCLLTSYDDSSSSSNCGRINRCSSSSSRCAQFPGDSLLHGMIQHMMKFSCIQWSQHFYCIRSSFLLQPIANRVAQNLEMISKNLQLSTRRTRILMGFILYYLVLIVNPMGRILVRWKSVKNNFEILCRPICHRLYSLLHSTIFSPLAFDDLALACDIFSWISSSLLHSKQSFACNLLHLINSLALDEFPCIRWRRQYSMKSLAFDQLYSIKFLAAGQFTCSRCSFLQSMTALAFDEFFAFDDLALDEIACRRWILFAYDDHAVACDEISCIRQSLLHLVNSVALDL